MQMKIWALSERGEADSFQKRVIFEEKKKKRIDKLNQPYETQETHTDCPPEQF